MKHLLAAVLALSALVSTAHAKHRVVLGGALAYTTKGCAGPEITGLGVSMLASSVGSIAFDGGNLLAT